VASRYSVIRYVPNPISEESINVGVAVFGGGPPIFRFVADWNRARRFSGEATEFIERFARQISDRQIGIFEDSGIWDEEQLRKVLGHWHNSIQFTAPRASLKEPEELIEEVSTTFLRGAAPRESHRHTRLQTRVKNLFNKMKVLAKEKREIHKHRVVPDFLIDQSTGLFADFALKRNVFYVMQTVDYQSAAPSGMAKFYETGAKALVLSEAKQKLGKDTMRYVIYSAHSEDRSSIRKYLKLLENHADKLIDYNSSKDIAAFGSMINKAAGRADLIHG